MSAPIRFVGLAIIAYVGLRTASSALALEAVAQPASDPPAKPADAGPAATTLPPGVAADMGPPASEPYAQAPAGAYGPMPGAGYGAYGPGYGAMPYPYMAAAAPMPQPMMAMPYPMMAAGLPAPRVSRVVYYPAPYPVAAASNHAAPPPHYGAEPVPAAAVPAPTSTFAAGSAEGYSQPVPALEQWPAIGTAGPFSLGGETQVTPSWGKKKRKERTSLNSATAGRWSADGWAMLRPPREGVYQLDDADGALNPGLASAGSLGGARPACGSAGSRYPRSEFTCAPRPR